MPLLLAGIDEAGYGPMLGPLCVARAVVRVADWAEGQPAPDLWDLLSSCVCKPGNDPRGRVAVNDSKKLKLPNDSATRHPLTHLERGVLSFLACRAAAPARPQTDAELFAELGAKLESHPWYAEPPGGPAACPASTTSQAIGVAANPLARGLAQTGVELVDLRVIAIGERAYNRLVRERGSKAGTTAAAFTMHLREILEHWATSSAPGAITSLRIVADRHGGRTDYADLLSSSLTGLQAIPGEVLIQTAEQTPARSRYQVRIGVRAPFAVLFQPEADAGFLPVALASMAAKLVRETIMARFNDHFCRLHPGLRPTAGYTEDARRWLAELGDRLSAEDRAALIRIA